jgi:putative alpha-1,2-mannosidase
MTTANLNAEKVSKFLSTIDMDDWYSIEVKPKNNLIWIQGNMEESLIKKYLKLGYKPEPMGEYLSFEFKSDGILIRIVLT